MSWFPDGSWAPWQALTAAGIRATSDPRSVAPPVVLFEVVDLAPAGTVGGCTVVEGTCKALCLAPGPDNGDSREWLWATAVPVLLPFSLPDRPATSELWGDAAPLPAVAVLIPISYIEEEAP